MNTKYKPRVLFVEDEPLALELMGRIMSEEGFELKSFNCPISALEWFKENSTMVDVVVTDQSMPRVTGTELVVKLRDIKPGLPAILVTGMGKIELSLDNDGPVSLIEKPYRRQELFNAIRAITGGEV